MSLFSFFKSEDTARVERLREQLKAADTRVSDMREELQKTIKQHFRDIEQLKHDHVVNLRDVRAECDGKVAAVKLELKMEKDSRANAIEEATKKETKALVEKCTAQDKASAVAEAKLNLYDKAFSEVGCDVNDVKEMCLELIKALGVKSQVNVISAK